MKLFSLPFPGRWPARAICALLALAALVACGRQEATPTAAPVASASQGPKDKQVLYYYDPMRPEVHFDKAGPSPFMDMQLVPKFADVAASSEGVSVDSAIIQSLGIRTAAAQRRDVRPRVRVPARVVADARGQARLQSRVTGWIEKLNVRSVGQSVAAGSVVAEIYSPELVQAQEELLLGADTVVAATERLRRFGISDIDIQAVRRAGKASRRLPLRAPVSGVVTDLGVREGSSVSSDTLIIDLSARSAVWIEAQLFPAQKLLLGARYTARFTLPGWPDKHWLATTGSVVPVADPVTQTVALRFPVSDAQDLPIGTVLDAEIEGEARTGVLLLPASAVIRSAKGDHVIVARGKQRFVPTPVRIGARYGTEIEILDGISVSDRVVTSGQFLLDAEASLVSGLDQMGSKDDAKAGALP